MAETADELIRQIAQDKAIDRFARRRPGVDAPRAVFRSVVDEVADHFSGSGWRYARSGPHLSRREGDISARVEFVSNRLNVAGEIVGLWVYIHLGDRTLGKWRKETGNLWPLGTKWHDVIWGTFSTLPGGSSGTWPTPTSDRKPPPTSSKRSRVQPCRGSSPCGASSMVVSPTPTP